MGIRVLSLFDGISVAQLALKELGIEVDKYYSSEIDKYAIAVTQHNFSNTIQLGDIRKLTDKRKIPKNIDILFAGFPCWSFSKLGTLLGTNSESGQLIFELLRIRDIVQPKYFLFENVFMIPDHLILINKLIGKNAITINSSNFSPQNRKRNYWTNIPIDLNTFPIDGGSCFSDIRDFRETRNLLKGDNVQIGKERYFVPLAARNPTRHTKGKLIQIGELRQKHELQKYSSKKRCEARIENRVYGEFGKYPCLTSAGLGAAVSLDFGETIRRPNSLERERLQSLPDNYTSVGGSISNYQRRIMLGNAWELNTIKYLLGSLC
jgi:DNA-cytosine methyltransferase